MRKGLIAAGVIVIAGGVTAALYSKSNSSKANGLKTIPVVRGSVVEKALAIGAIRPKREIAVKSKISGIVKTSYREIGDKVRPGDPLFEILPDPTPMELTEARREVEIARNVFDQAKKKHDRSRTLKEQGILATQDWDQAEKDIQDAQIRLSLSTERLALIGRFARAIVHDLKNPLNIIGLTAEPRFVRVYKWKGAMAQYGVGHLERLKRIEALRRKLRGLALAGNAFTGIGVPDCVRSGREAANKVLSEIGIEEGAA